MTLADLSDKDGWHNVRLPLAGYEGKTVQIKFHAVMDEYRFTPIDNIFIGTESAPIGDVAADPAASVEVKADATAIEISNPAGLSVTVFSPSGMVEAVTDATAARVSLPAGVHIVRCGRLAVKVAVR